MASRYTRAGPIAFSAGGNRETAVGSDSATGATRLPARPPRLQKSAAPADLERVIFAGGRFWGLQSLLRRYPNVVRTRVGYIGGDHPEPTHQSIGSHAEAVEVVFGAGKPGYRRLAEFFFQIHDPSTWHRQGDDIGSRYRSAVFYTTSLQMRISTETVAAIDACGLWPGPVVTEIIPATTFWEAEPEHQDYLDRHPGGYKCQFIRPDWILPAKRGGRHVCAERGRTARKPHNPPSLG
jgi:peptide-methionine (S)-S-oxide reductase